MVILFVLMVYSYMVLGEATTLRGAQSVRAKPKISKLGWFTGHYQMRFERSASSNFAFYTPLVMMNNQWNFSVWGKPNAQDVILGEDNYLFEQGYIDGLYGLGIDDKRERFSEVKEPIKYVDQKMKEEGSNLLFVMMPSKTFYHPTKIPKKQQSDISENQIHTDFLKFAEANQLNVIDFQNYFLEQRDNIPYPIFPKHGIHISKYVESLVLDSLLNYIEELQNHDLYGFHFSELLETNIPQGRDNDIAQVLNLIKPIVADETLAYRDIIFDRIDEELEPKVLVIGDSFYWGFNPTINHHQLFERHEFWYRNNQIFSPGASKTRFSNKAACMEAMDIFDLTIVMVSANNMDFVGWGFFEHIYEERDNSDLPKEAWPRINDIIYKIKNDRKHFNLVWEKSVNENISLDSMIYLDAKWLYEQEQ